MDNIKENLTKNLKSSSRFGDLFITKNWQELLKERRFLFFTKRGPIEIVFNIKHYLSGFFLSLLVTFKVLQFLFFGALQIISTIMIHNSAMQEKQFTESEVLALKELAETVKETNQEIFDMGIIATRDASTVWGSEMYGYYDLRFLFELIYAGLDANHKEIMNAFNKA